MFCQGGTGTRSRRDSHQRTRRRGRQRVRERALKRRGPTEALADAGNSVASARCESIEDKLALVAAAPDRYSTTDHYDGLPIVLVNLTSIDVAEMHAMIIDSWRVRAAKKLVAHYDQSTPGHGQGDTSEGNP